MDTKLCIACSTTKPLEEFNRCKGAPLGRYTYCKVCVWRSRHEGLKLTKRNVVKRSDIPQAINNGRVCRICLTEKPSNAYNGDKSRPDGFHPYCRECVKRRKSSPEGLAIRRKRRTWAKESARAYHHQYMRRPEVRARSMKKVKQYQEQWPDKTRVHRALRWAVWSKKIIKPRACQGCYKIGRIEAHHYLGYAWENRFNVWWLCRHCHAAKHLRYPDEAPK